MSNEVVDRLKDRRLQLWEEAKSVAERASTENRNFSAEEQGQWDGIMSEIDNLDARIKATLGAQERQKEATDAYERVAAWTDKRLGGNGTDGRAQEQKTEELRAFLRGDPGAPRSFDVERPAGTPPTLDLRTLTKGVVTDGGNTVPTSFYNRLMAHMIEVSGVLQAGVTVLNTDSGESLDVPKTLTHSTGTLTTEGASVPTSDPSFGKITLGAYKYGVMVQLSRELIDDSGVDLEGYLAMQAGRAIGNALGADLVTGDGSSKPRGILATTGGTTAGVTGSTGVSGGFPTGAGQADNLIDLFYSVIAPYRSSASCGWLVRDKTMAAIRKLRDTTGNYIFQPSLTVGTPDTLIGKPIYTDPVVPAMATGAKSIVFGDFSQYFVRLAGGIRFERSDEYLFGYDLVAFRCLLRGDGSLIDLTGALKHFLAPSS